ncbi:MAG: porin [Alphaproteobacteria bacterium]|nr:porin [Alphaproteobacteria bacterium]MBV8547856.1 porin [Alphaproteobacteria bacterium]
MQAMSKSNIFLTASALALITSLAPVGAHAAASQTANLQNEINDLQAQLNQLKAQQTAAAAPVTTAPAAADSSSTVVDKVSNFMNSDAPLTWSGITLYGTLDVGVSNQSHGTAYNANFPTSVGEMLQKNASGAVWSVTPNGLEQSKIGLKGEEAVLKNSTYGDVNAVFKLEAGFNPVSGVLSNAQQSQINNNGNTVLARTSTNGDSSRDGQVFEGAAYGGLSNKTFGTLTFGRQTTVLADDVVSYDPQGSSYAFSPIEWSGTVQGGGYTEDARYDDSLKYSVAYGPVRFAGIYQFAGNTNTYGGDDAYQGDIGVDYAGLSVDALLATKHDAVLTSTNSAATAAAGNLNQLKATVADTNTYGFFARYDFKDAGVEFLKPAKVFVGYEHIRYSNPNDPLSANATSLGGFSYAAINSTAYSTNEKLNVVWGGVRYAFTPKLTVSAADYAYSQNDYAGAGSGTQNYSSLVADYQLTKRIDAYAGLMYSRVFDGMAVGYIHNNNLSTDTGLRFKF